MCLIRIDQHVEPISSLIQGLENGTRTLTSLQTAMLLREMNEALEALREASIVTQALGLNQVAEAS